jgi:Group II intron, maturase-specific domain
MAVTVSAMFIPGAALGFYRGALGLEVRNDIRGPPRPAEPKTLRWSLWPTPARVVRRAPPAHRVRVLDGWPTASEHCVTERQARNLVVAIGDRMEQVGLRLHPDKTKVVYCQDGKRRLDSELTAFTFLGFTFRARPARTTHGKMFVSFQPAISKDAQKKISGQIRRWRLHRRIGHTFADLARQINPVVRGWMQYYGAFYRSALNPLLSRIKAYLMRWIRNKYKRLRPTKKATASWQREGETPSGYPTATTTKAAMPQLDLRTVELAWALMGEGVWPDPTTPVRVRGGLLEARVW